MSVYLPVTGFHRPLVIEIPGIGSASLVYEGYELLRVLHERVSRLMLQMDRGGVAAHEFVGLCASYADKYITPENTDVSLLACPALIVAEVGRVALYAVLLNEKDYTRAFRRYRDILGFMHTAYMAGMLYASSLAHIPARKETYEKWRERAKRILAR